MDRPITKFLDDDRVMMTSSTVAILHMNTADSGHMFIPHPPSPPFSLFKIEIFFTQEVT